MNRRFTTHIKSLGCALMLGVLGSCSSDDNSEQSSIIKVKPDYNVNFTQQDFNVYDGITNFSHKLISEVLTNEDDMELHGKNFVISPLNCAIDIAMLAESTDSVSAQKLCKILEVPDIESLGTACNKVMTYLYAPENKTEIEIANSIWYANQYAANIPARYIKKMNTTYFADINSTDLATEAGKKAINSWINAKTDGLIYDLNGPLEASQNLDALILSAFYFNYGDLFSFERYSTTNGIFHTPTGDQRIKMMVTDCLIGRYEDDEKEVFIMHYRVNQWALAFIMPKNGYEMKDVCPNYEEWYAIWNHIGRPHMGTLRVPRLSIESNIELNTLSMFNTIGNMPLNGMGLPSCKIGTICQKSYFNFDEDGVESTSVSRGALSDPYPDEPSEWLYATIDRPFLFYIVNPKISTVIMEGRVLDPTKK